MKYEINLWRLGRKPKRVPKPKGEEIRISVAILIPLMILLLLGISFAYMTASSSLERKIRMNRAQKVYLSNQLSEVAEEKEKASNELKLLSSLRGKRVLWSRKLEDLSEIMPDELWLTDLSIRTVKKKRKDSKEIEEETYLIIKGATEPVLGQERADSIAQLISSLNSLDSFHRDFDPATLVNYTHLSRGKERELMEFEISAKLKGVPGASGGKAAK